MSKDNTYINVPFNTLKDSLENSINKSLSFVNVKEMNCSFPFLEIVSYKGLRRKFLICSNLLKIDNKSGEVIIKYKVPIKFNLNKDQIYDLNDSFHAVNFTHFCFYNPESNCFEFYEKGILNNFIKNKILTNSPLINVDQFHNMETSYVLIHSKYIKKLKVYSLRNVNGEILNKKEDDKLPF